MKKVVLVDLKGFPKLDDDLLKGIAQAEYYYDVPDDQTVVKRCKDAHVVVWGWVSLTKEVMEQCPDLEMVCYLGVGASNQVDMEYAKEKNITITNTPHYGDVAVAEHGIALMMALARHVVRTDKSTRQGGWEKPEVVELRDSTVGIIGLGGVGSELAAIGNGLGMKVICHTKHPSPERAKKHKVKFGSLEEVMAQSDFIQLAQALSDETRGMIGEKQLGLMKPTAFLINIARAEIVDGKALLKALKEQAIAGYATDVFEVEPPSKDESLFNLDNVIVTPHNAFNTPQSTINMFNIAIDDVKSFLEGKPKNIYKL